MLEIGTLIFGILVILGFAKKLRNDTTLIILLVVTGIIGGIGIWIRDPEYEIPKGNEADFLIMPFAYVVAYKLLRKLYKSIYKVEPTYNRSSWYDYEEGRKQNWLDLLVHIAPIIISGLTPLVIGKLLK